MRVKVIANADLTKPGDMYMLKAETVEAVYEPGPRVVFAEPLRIVVCHPKDEGKIREAIKGDRNLELGA